MHPKTLELMREQARAIYRAVTGSAMPEDDALPPAEDVPVDEVARRFTELEGIARTIPVVVERVPPFSFAPPIDAIDDPRELLIEVAVPGIERGDVTVEQTGELLVVSGLRAGERASDGRSYLHAEIPRGPFHRVIRLPYPTAAEPQVEVERGLIRIKLAKARRAPPKA